jgi:predicted ATPase
MLMALPGAQVLELSEDGIQPVHYSDTDHFRTAKYFLNNPERILHDLLGE